MAAWRTMVTGSVALLAASGAWAAGKPHDQSWGKAGISFEQYRADTLTCSNTAYGVDIHMLPRTLASLKVMDASLIDLATSSLPIDQRQAALAASAAPGRVIVRTSAYQDLYDHAATYDVIEQLQAVVDRCLVDHGYRRFRLTGVQMRRLGELRQGTEQRARYLYSLGTDPQVLAAQSI